MSIKKSVLFLGSCTVFNLGATGIPPMLPEAFDRSEPRLAKYYPVFDYDGDGCLPSVGIGRDGTINGGLKTTGKLGGDCRNKSFLDQSNTMHRGQCKFLNGKNYCIDIYAQYFQKDQAIPSWDPGIGHRHDWEAVLIWTTNGVMTHGSVTHHGGVNTYPVAKMTFIKGHPLFIYHKEGVKTHMFRLGSKYDAEHPENSYGTFVTPTIVSWECMYGNPGVDNQILKKLFNTTDFDRATSQMRDDEFYKTVKKSPPPGYPVMLFSKFNFSVFTEGATCKKQVTGVQW